MIKINDFLCHGIIFDKCRVLSPAIIQANVGDTVWWTQSPAGREVTRHWEHFNEGPESRRKAYFEVTGIIRDLNIRDDWPRLPQTETQYCNLEIFPRRGPGVTMIIRLVTRHTFHVTWSLVTHCTWEYTRRPGQDAPPRMMMIRRFVFALPCECFHWVSWCHLAKQSLNARIYLPPRRRKERRGAGLGFVRHNLTFNVEINFKIWYFTIVKT